MKENKCKGIHAVAPSFNHTYLSSITMQQMTKVIVKCMGVNMAYQIAVSSSDGINVDRSFGSAERFLIYEVAADGTYHLTEIRGVQAADHSGTAGHCASPTENNCGNGAGTGPAGGCGGAGEHNPKVALIEDCRCIICQKIGFQVQKQLEKRAIVSFDVDCEIETALQKITQYFERVDSHQSLRGIAKTR